jgi:hypothetical protein
VRRKLFTLCSAASLVLCVGLCALEVRSRWATEGWIIPVNGRVAHVMSARGGIYLAWFGGPWVARGSPVRWHTAGPADFAGMFGGTRAVVGFRYVNSEHGGGRTFRAAVVPRWPMILLAAAASAVCRWRAILAGRRSAEGRCPVCGYDLRATPERCPECGAAGTTTA